MASIREIETKKGKGYQIDYYDINGSRRRKTVYCSKRKANNIAKSLEWKKANVELGLENVVDDHISLSEAVIKYLSIVEYQKKETTLKRERLVYNSFQEYIGCRTRLGTIQTRDIEGYLVKRQKHDNMSPDTVHIEIRVLKQFFNNMIKYGYAVQNPVKGIKGPKRPVTKIRFLTLEEIATLLETIDDQDYHDLVTTYIYTGARKAEILAPQFTWDDVEFDKKRIRLKGKRDKVDYIHVTDTVFEIFRRRKEVMLLQYPFELDYYKIHKRIKKYFEKAGIENASIHTFRKTFGSILAQEGVEILRISKLCRHSSVLVTQKHYADLIPENLSESVEILDAAIKKAKEKKKAAVEIKHISDSEKTKKVKP